MTNRFRYPPGHPCYYEEPEVVPCEAGCPDGEICDEETGECVIDESQPRHGEGLSEAASLLDSFLDGEGTPFEEVSEEDLPFPNEQITFEENNIQFAARDKIVANQGCAYWIWDSPASRFRSQDLDETAMGLYFAEDWTVHSNTFSNQFWGFPGQSAIFQDPANKFRAHNYDPLRWSTGKVWTHRLPPQGSPDSMHPSFVFPSTFSELEHKNKYFLKVVYPTNVPPPVLYTDESGNYSDETIYLQFGGALYHAVPEAQKLNFFKNMLVGTDATDHTTEPVYDIEASPGDDGLRDVIKTGEVNPKLRSAIEEMYNDIDRVNETLRAKFFSKGALGEETSKDMINNEAAIVPKTYVDFAHKTQMPFFDKESKKMNISHGLSADIEIHRNFFSKGFQSTSLGTSEDIFEITNCYRHYRERKRPNENCEISLKDQVDRILKFSAGNIKEMNEVTEQYKKVYPVTAQIRFDTTQRNTISDMFTRYGMDKYFLDQREKFINLEDARSPDVHVNSHLESFNTTSGQLSRDSQDEFYYSYDIGGYSIFKVRTYAEYLNQVSMKSEGGGLGEIENYMSTSRNLKYFPKGASLPEVDNRAFNMSTEMRTAYLEDFLYQLRINPDAQYNQISDQMYDKFDDNMFPLGVLDTAAHSPDDSPHSQASADWRKTVNDFNREIFAARISSLPYENTSNSNINDPTSSSKYSRSFKDILNGKLAYSEVLGYSIEKYEHTTGEEKKLVQKFYFFDSSDVREVNFLDNQLRYNKKYTYVIKAINCVFGSEYYYKINNEAKTFANGEIADSDDNFNFVDEFVRGATAGDVEERDRRFVESFTGAFNAGGDWSRYVLGARVRTKPRIAFIEVPYFKKTIHTVDLPPMPPQVEIVPYKGDLSRVLVNLTPSAGEFQKIPRPIIPGDAAKIEAMYRAQDVALYKKVEGMDLYDPSGPIKYSGDSMPTEYEMLILESPQDPPISIDRFATAKVKRFGNLIAGNLHKDIILKVNVPNYIVFRALDNAGVSTPSDTYYVELVSHQDGMYLVVEEYIYPETTPELTRAIKSAIEFSPSQPQFAQYEDPVAPPTDAFSIGQPPPRIWDKEYRLNIKSKTTGRELNVNFDYRVIDSPSPPSPDDPLGDDELDALLESCNRYTHLPQDMRDSELYRPPERIDTGAAGLVVACPASVPTEVSKMYKFFTSGNWDPTNLELAEILRGSVPTRNQTLKSHERRFDSGPLAGECGCPPSATRGLDTINGADDLNQLVFDLNLCISTNVCPQGSEARITTYTNAAGNTRAMIHCLCMGSKEPCKADCLEPCPEFHARGPDCGCKPDCPPPKIWNGETCSCPEGYVDHGFRGCIRPTPAPVHEQPEYQDMRNQLPELSQEALDDLERAGSLNEATRRMIEAGTVDVEQVMSMLDRLESDGGVVRPASEEGEGGVGTGGTLPARASTQIPPGAAGVDLNRTGHGQLRLPPGGNSGDGNYGR